MVAEQKETPETRLFWKYARKHLPEMRLLFREGKLSKKEGGWNNVIDHGLVQAAASDVLASLLGLSEEDNLELRTAALCHDWKKRLEKRPNDFTQEEKEKAISFLSETALNSNIMAATEAGFNLEILQGDVTPLQELMFYIDHIAMGNKIVSPEKRIREAETRTSFTDPELLKKLEGKNFWDVERRAAHLVEKKILKRLKQNGVQIEKPEDIPIFIKEGILKLID